MEARRPRITTALEPERTKELAIEKPTPAPPPSTFV
jgi:hypothetical protein